MNKETKTYIINITKSEYFIIDLLCLLSGLAVLILSVLSFVTGKMEDFGVVFILGAFLALFNLIKTAMRKSFVGMLMFSALTVAMFVMIAVIYGYFL